MKRRGPPRHQGERLVGIFSSRETPVREVMEDMRFTIRQLEGYIRSGG